MTFINHSNNLSFVTLSFPSSTPPSSSSASQSSPSSSSWTQKIKQKIDELKSELDNLKNLKEAKNGYLTENDSKSLDSLPTQLTSLETVQKLAEFADQLDTTKTNPTNILNNLCSGLETFLGFNSTSKGYDGTGIVYSDLDRLCDGVMGFLSGVLDAVKDDDAVKTYDNYMLVDKRLNKVIEKLNSKIGSGRAGLAASVDAVREWLEGYGREVKEKTENVETRLKDLSNSISYGMSEVTNSNDKNLKTQLTVWSDTLARIETNMNETENDYISLLDKGLKNKVDSEWKQIKTAVDVMKRLSGDDDLKTLNEMARRQLDELKINLQSKVVERLITVRDDLQNEFTVKIQTQIVNVNLMLKGVKKALNDWIYRAYWAVNKAIGKVQKIAKYLEGKEDNDIGITKRKAVEQSALNLMQKADELRKAASETKQAVERFVETTQNKLRLSHNSLMFALGKVKAEINNKIKEVVSSIASLGSVFKQHGSQVTPDSIERIMKHIKAEVDVIKEKVGIEKTATGNAEGSIDKNWHLLKEKLTTDVNAIYNKKRSGNLGYLGDIENTVKAYSALFREGERGFQKILDTWLKDIIGKEPVSGFLTLYFKENKGSGYFDGRLKDDISQALGKHISPVLTKHVQEAINKIKSKTDFDTLNSVDEKLSYIKDYLNTFSSSVMNEEQEIIRTVEGEVKHNDKLVTMVSRGFYKSYYLKVAVQAILAALASIAKQVAQQIATFTDEGTIRLGTNLKAAILTLNKIGEQLTTEGGTLGAKIQQALDVVKPKIETLQHQLRITIEESSSGHPSSADVVDQTLAGVTKTLDVQLPFVLKGKSPFAGLGDSPTPIELNGAQSFVNYNKYIAQHVSADGKIQPLAGTVPDAVKQIQNEGLSSLTNLIVDGPVGTDKQIGTGTFEAMLSTFNSQFAAFIKAVKELVKDGTFSGIKSNDSVHHYLEDLYKMIEQKANKNVKLNAKYANDSDPVEGLRKIEQDIISILQSNLNGNLKSIIENASNFYNKIQQDVDNCIGLLKSDVQEQVQSATTKITEEAQRLYAERKKTELSALSNLLEKHKSAIENIINTDSASGLKGLLKALYGAQYRIPNGSRHSVIEISSQFNNYLMPIFTHISTEVPSPSSQLVADLQARTYALLTHLHENKRTFTFDSEFRSLLHDLTSALSTFDPATFANPQHPQLLDALKAGMRGLVGEMEKAYVNRYDSQKIKWVKDADTKNPKATEEPTADATRCAKVFMSCLPMWVEDLGELKRKCEHSWSKRAIHLKDEIEKENPLGEFFKQCGYSVPTSQKSHQDGELQCRHQFTGKHIDGILGKVIEMPNYEHVPQCRSPEKKWNFNIIDFLLCLYSHLEEYNEVCHLSTICSKKHPCSIYEILCWFSGLPHSTVYSALTDSIAKLLDKPKNQPIDSGDVELEIEFDDKNAYYLDAHPNNFTYKDIYAVIELLCSKSYDVLARIAGTGDEHTRYACEYANNSLNLHYPKTADDCLPMLLDMLRRLLSVFRFLESKCSYSALEFGWADCQYGKNVRTTKSHCNDRSTDEVTCQAKCKPKCQPKCQPNSHPNCQPTSPLMSYLNDCLPGHLPHQLTNVGCKPECKTCPGNKPGMPCLTPLGFRGFSGSTKTGEDICRLIKEILGNGMIACLFTLSPKTPTTLPEHFQFVLSLVNKWNKSGSHLIKDAFIKSISSRSIGLYDQPGSFTDALCNAYGSTQNGHPKREVKFADLSSLSSTTAHTTQTAYTAPYVYALCCDSYRYLTPKLANSYLSWVVYLPWALHTYLEGLRDALKDIFCHDWGCSTCLHGDECKKGEHGIIENSCKCSSVVSCRGVPPTLYKYGFTFEDAKSLTSTKKTCFAFIQQIQNVITSTYFTELFKHCDNFLFKIRAPFLWMTVALWSLSLFYLICVMVGRLDVLHIRSHLRIPSSHKITAQSLLAAAQVKRLAKISYLQP